MAHFFGLHDRVYRYSQTIGKQSFQGGPGFFQLTDLTIGKDGVIYVVNRCAPEVERGRPGVRVVMCTLDEEYLGDLGGYGEGDGQFIWPTAIAQDSDQNIYVSDEWLHRISVFDKKGKFLHRWGLKGSGPGEFDGASGLVFDRLDRVYLADSNNDGIQGFTKEGKFLSAFGAFGNSEGQFNMPWGLTIDRKGDLYVADWRNDRGQKFSPDGKFLAAFGSSGSLIAQFNRPTDVAVDKDGDVYVVDWMNHRVQVFTPEFRYVTHFQGEATISKWAERQLRTNPDYMRMWGLVRDPSPVQRFWFPVAVEVDQQGRVIIADGARFRLQIYVKGEMLLPGYKG